jgi:Gas vesicle synthesis protein GvpL/GvpF
MRYVYGVVRSAHKAPPDELYGVGRPPASVRLVSSGPLAAVVSDVDDDFVVEEADARAHVHVLIGLLGGGPVVPLRLGTVAPDDDAARAEVLDAARDELAGALDGLDGLVELHVDADDNEAEAIAAIAGAAPIRPGESLDFQSALEAGQHVAQLLIEHRQRLAEEIVERLRPIAVRDTPRSVITGPEDPVLRWAFLVKADDITTFDETMVSIRAAYPSLAIRYVGPLPAAHFVDWRTTPDSEETDPFQAQGNWGW